VKEKPFGLWYGLPVLVDISAGRLESNYENSKIHSIQHRIIWPRHGVMHDDCVRIRSSKHQDSFCYPSVSCTKVLVVRFVVGLAAQHGFDTLTI
jgi:hypothetical protein